MIAKMVTKMITTMVTQMITKMVIRRATNMITNMVITMITNMVPKMVTKVVTKMFSVGCGVSIIRSVTKMAARYRWTKMCASISTEPSLLLHMHVRTQFDARRCCHEQTLRPQALRLHSSISPVSMSQSIAVAPLRLCHSSAAPLPVLCRDRY